MKFGKPIEIPISSNIKMYIVGVQWDKATLTAAPFLAERGWGNGYIRLPKGHKYYGSRSDDIPYDCYGGLTFAGEEIHNNIEYWTIGFDTGHYHSNPSMDKRWLVNEVYQLQLQAIKDLK